MKIACCGTSPYSVRLIPYGDTSWLIWGCSPGLYPLAGRLNAWFELHRWEPPTLGRPDQQVPWLSPEYCGWMAQRQHVVWMAQKLAAIPNSQALPVEQLVDKYGHYFFTSSLAWMAAMAIEAILLNRDLLAAGAQEAVQGIPGEPDAIGFWGVDMSTEEEYVQQRSGCQFFATVAASLNIKVVVPPESDLLIPPALYGISEGSPRAIRSRARMDMMKARKAQADAQLIAAHKDVAFMDGQMDAEQHHIRTWTHEGEIKGARFEDLFAKPIQPAPLAPQTTLTSAAHGGPAGGSMADGGAQVSPPAVTPDPVVLAEAKLAGNDPHAPEKATTLRNHGLERLCANGSKAGETAYCRRAWNEECDCIAPIRPAEQRFATEPAQMPKYRGNTT